MTQRPELDLAHTAALTYLAGLRERPVGPADPADSRDGFEVPLPEEGSAPQDVVARLLAAAEPGLVASSGPRYFGYVVGVDFARPRPLAVPLDPPPPLLAPRLALPPPVSLMPRGELLL